MNNEMKKSVFQQGFTLTELLIVVAIIGILYGVALPSYTEHMERSRRADIQHVMLQYAASLERIYSRNGGYPNAFNGAINTEFYTFSYIASDRVPGAAANDDFRSRKYTLKATPKSGSAQASDRCGALTLTHDGSQLPNTDSCWG